MSRESDRGLKASDAKPVVDIACNHPGWNRLNKALGCIHPDHGEYPFSAADHHTGVRLVDGVPTRWNPS